MQAMMQAVLAEPDQHVVLRDVAWKDFERLVAMRGESNRPMLFYLDGEIELVSPSLGHEYAKKTLARLLEAWATDTDTMVEGYGEVLLKRMAKRAGAQPDECYLVGRIGPGLDPRRKSLTPDLVIEIEWSRALGLRKEEIYRRLGVKELWTFRHDGTFVLRARRGDRWIESKTSGLLPELDVFWLVSFTTHASQTEAVRAMRRSLKRK